MIPQVQPPTLASYTPFLSKIGVQQSKIPTPPPPAPTPGSLLDHLPDFVQARLRKVPALWGSAPISKQMAIPAVARPMPIPLSPSKVKRPRSHMFGTMASLVHVPLALPQLAAKNRAAHKQLTEGGGPLDTMYKDVITTLGETPNLPTPDGIEIVLVRQVTKDGKTTGKVEWTSNSTTKSDAIADENARDAVRHIEKFIHFAQKAIDDNPIIKRLVPAGFKLFAGKRIIVGIDFYPTPGDDDEANGYANAFHTMGPREEVMMIFGAPPKPGSQLFDIVESTTKDASIPAHELWHAVNSAISAAFKGFSSYMGYTGAQEERSADAGAKAGISTEYLKRPLTRADMLIGDHWIKGPGALRDLVQPGTARDPNHPFGPDMQVGRFGDYDRYRTPTHHATEEKDRGGVHLHSGELITPFSMGVLNVDNGDPMPSLHIITGVRILASMNNLEDLPVHDTAFLHILSAWMCFGDTRPDRVQKELEIWQELGILDKSIRSYMEIIDTTQLKDYHDNPPQDMTGAGV
ncbi:MAG: hypothetical protein HQM16_04350 [Deltaproteobacteria bacterium]|nr:hypothetical protein [Deltaproteobacteria bacterium]